MKVKVIAMATAGLLALSSTQAMAADAEAGEDVYKKRCAACHNVEPGKHKTGPSLHGVYGRQAGSTDFKRYSGLVGADFVWETDNLYTYLEDPKSFVVANTNNKRSAMAFRLKDSDQRYDVIEYLKTLK
jgi:cytochrome c